MKELLKAFIDWAKKNKRYPLLFPLITPAIYFFVQNYFLTRSFAGTINHEAFLICSGSVVLISGVLYFLLKRKERTRLIAGCFLATLGLIAIIYGISILIPCKVTSEQLIVAVVEFDPAGENAENDAIEIRDTFWRKLQDSKKQGVPIIAKKLNKRITFEDPDKDGRKAAKHIGRSKKGCAHLVIWGEVSRKGSKKDDIAIAPYITVAQQMAGTQIAESQFLGIDDTDVNFHTITSSKIIDIVKYIGGVAYYKKGDWPNAIKMCERVELYEAMIMSGMAKLMIGDLESSLAAFKNASELRPNDISSYNSLGMVYLQMNRYEQSKLYFTKALDINEKSFAARNNLGITNLKLHDYKSAETNFKIALKEKENPTIYSNLAFCLFELNSVPEAIKNWKISVDLFSRWPSYPGIEYDQADANAGLSIGYFADGKYEKAINLYRNVLEHNLDYADIAKLENEYFWPPKARSIAIELINKIKSNPN